MSRKTETPETDAPETVETDPLAALDNPEEIDTASTVEVPEKVKAFVERAHHFWTLKPRKWQAVTLATETDVKRIARQAKAHAQANGWTFRRKTVTNKTMLVYRVSDAPVKEENREEPAA